MKNLNTIFNLKLILVFVTLSFVSCSKDSNEPSPFNTTITASDFSVSMDENPENDQVIGTISASTNQGSITFSLVEQTPANAFKIDAATGELKVANKGIFDFETNPIITGIIRVSNEFNYKDASVTITLNDSVEENVFQGGIALFTQEEVNTFGAKNYSKITGGLTIGSTNGEYSSITDLSPLASLKTVEEQINLAHNNLLENLSGLNNLEEIGSYFLILNNPSLKNISGLGNLNTINNYLVIDNNDSLNNLQGLENITAINHDLIITGNEILTDIKSLKNLATIGKRLSIRENPNLLNFNFTNLTAISESLIINDCPKLTNLNTLTNLNAVGIDLFIYQNIALADFCGLQGLLIGNGLGGDFTIFSNAYNPTKQDIIDGNCSL